MRVLDRIMIGSLPAEKIDKLSGKILKKKMSKPKKYKKRSSLVQVFIPRKKGLELKNKLNEKHISNAVVSVLKNWNEEIPSEQEETISPRTCVRVPLEIFSKIESLCNGKCSGAEGVYRIIVEILNKL